MSKVDAQRAMREAKYARDSASGPTRREAAAAAAGTSSTAPVRTSQVEEARPARPARTTKAAPVADAAPQGALCGHKSMNGRECTREAGHAEKNHRYG